MRSLHTLFKEWLPERLALFASSFAPHLGGVEELVRQLAVHQLRAGAQPVVHTMRWPRDLPAREVHDGCIDVRRHNYRTPEGSFLRIATAAFGNPGVLASLIRQLRNDRAQLIHIQCVSSGAWFAYRAARVLQLPTVVSLQGELLMDADQIYEHSPLLRHTLRLLLRRADAITGCSQAVLDEAQSWANIDLGDRASVVFNGVSATEFRQQGHHSLSLGCHPRPYVLGIGRHVRQKGFDVLIDAFSYLVADPSFGWDLVLAGDGPQQREYVARASRLGIADRVHFVGRADRTLVVALFSDAMAFALPSLYEPFGIVNLEAMSAGTPIVASRVGGVPEVISDGVSGLLVDPGDPVDLARSIRILHGDPVLRNRLIEKGLQVVKRFDWSTIEHQYREVYASARARSVSSSSEDRPR